MTQASLNSNFEKVEKQRRDILAQLKAYDDKVLNQRPSENSWSVIEVIDHLVAAEKSTLQYLEKKTQDLASAQKVGLKEKFRSLVLNAYLGSSKKFKSPEVALPGGQPMSLSQVRDSWDQVRSQIQAVWTRLPEHELDKNWFKHPAAGKLSFAQMLTFMQAHVGRHHKQISRTLREVTP